MKTATQTKPTSTTTITPIATVKTKKSTPPKATVTIELGAAATAYKAMVKSSEANLKTLKQIGEALNVIRAEFKCNTKFSNYIGTTPLVIMTRQDRNDAMYLATNWDMIQTFKKEKSVASNSIGTLRKKMAAAKKTNKAPVDKKTKTTGKKLDIVNVTEYVLEILKENDLTTLALIKALQSTIK